MRNKLGLNMARDQIYSSKNLPCLQTPDSAGRVNTRSTWNKKASVSKMNILNTIICENFANDLLH